MLAMGRTACGYTQSEFASLIDMPQGRLSRIEDGLTAGMEPGTLAKCAEVTGYPVEFFTQEGGAKALPESFFRRRKTMSVKVLKRAEALINAKRMEIEKLLQKAELEPQLTLPRWSPEDWRGGAREIARQLRVAWGIPSGPIKNLTALVEAAGCVVVPFDFGTPHIDGVSTTTADGVPLIFINIRHTAARFRLTLAHELGHAIMHTLPTPDMEDEAFDFAAEFMAPEDEVKASFFPLDLEKLARLKLKWGLSMQFFLRWAKTLGRIKDAYSNFLHMRIAKAGWKTVEPYDNETPVEKPSLLRELVAFVLQHLGYTLEELRHVLKANARSFRMEYAA